ncbi:MAG TPA: hypothetical protein DCM86_02510 [Verrucomicrobiales bacterium]|nr:hypothetical protein [Verrucomicrobiales bacterium]
MHLPPPLRPIPALAKAGARAAVVAWLPLANCGSGAAESTVQRSTNYYTVTGASLPAIEASLQRSRPFVEMGPSHAYTTWNIRWNFQTESSSNGCLCSGFSTETRIRITLPYWQPSTNSRSWLPSAWNDYFQALRLHEAHHAELAEEAATEIHRRVSALGGSGDCDSLKRQINTTGEAVLEEYRQKQKAYDVETRHGATQGAVLGGIGVRPRREEESKPPPPIPR